MSEKNLNNDPVTVESLAQSINTLTTQLNEERIKREKTNKIKTIFTIGAFVLLAIYGIMATKLYNYYRSEAFLDNVKFKAVEITPYVSKELGNVAQKSAPIIFEQLKSSVEAYLPTLSKKANEQYKAVLDQATLDTQKSIDALVLSEVDAVLKRSNIKLDEVRPMSDEQFKEVKEGMIKELTKTADNLLNEKMQDQLFQCTTGVQNLQDTVKKISEIPEKDRKKASFDIMKGILDAVEQNELGTTK